jgi:hypothetical protein
MQDVVSSAHLTQYQFMGSRYYVPITSTIYRVVVWISWKTSSSSVPIIMLLFTGMTLFSTITSKGLFSVMADRNHWHLTNTYSNQDDIILRREATGKWTANVSDIQTASDHEAGHAQQQAMDDPDRVRTAATADSQVRVPETALASQAEYDVFLQSLHTDVVSTWRWEVGSEVRPSDMPAECTVLLEYVNASPMAEKSPNTEAFLSWA